MARCWSSPARARARPGCSPTGSPTCSPPIGPARARSSGAKNRLLDAASMQEADGSVFEQTASEVFALYERRMLEANAMDFDDLLVRTVNVLELFEPARDRWRRAFQHVLVDEYQDTNRAQYRLLQLLAEEHRDLFVVGDDAQSIYSFRHAEIRNISTSSRTSPTPTW